MAMARTQNVSLQKIGLEVRVSWVKDAFVPRKNDRGSEGYTLTCLIPKSANIAPLAALIKEAAQAEWGGKLDVTQALNNGLIKNPLLDGDGPQGLNKTTGKRHAGYAGHYFIRCTATTTYPPTMWVQRNGAFVPATQADIKSGDFGYPVINAYCWVNDQNGRGVTFGFSDFLKSRSGESLGGEGGPYDPNQMFDTLPDEGEAPKETAAGAGAGGLFG